MLWQVQALPISDINGEVNSNISKNIVLWLHLQGNFVKSLTIMLRMQFTVSEVAMSVAIRPSKSSGKVTTSFLP
jgi:hypothetical protein